MLLTCYSFCFFSKQLQSGYSRYVIGLGIVATLGGLAYYCYTRCNADNKCTRNCRCGDVCRCGKNCTCPSVGSCIAAKSQLL